MEESFNPLDLLECDVVEGEGEVQIPDVNKGELSWTVVLGYVVLQWFFVTDFGIPRLLL